MGEKSEKVDEDPLMMEEDGLEGFLPQEDEGKYPAGDLNMISQNLEQNDDDIFAGTDMANDRVVDPDPLEDIGDNMQNHWRIKMKTLKLDNGKPNIII